MMRQIKMNKKVGLFVLLFVVVLSVASFSIINIFAEDKKTDGKVTDTDGNKYKEICSSKEELLNKYNPDLKIDGDAYTLTLKPSTSGSEGNLNQVSFLVSKVAPIVGDTQEAWVDISGQGLYVSGNNSLVINKNAGYLADTIKKGEGNLVFLLTTEKDPTCDKVELNVEISVAQPVKTAEDVSISDELDKTIKQLQATSYASSEINCNSPANDAEKLICYAKNHNDAKKNGSITHTTSFTCDPNRFYYDTTKYKSKITKADGTVDDQDKNSPYEHLDGISFPNDNRNSDDPVTYYVNKKYLYDSEEHTINNYTYKYHFNPDGAVKTETVSCKVKCEEGVVVEYGPPVASKAGLCFQYKIKVTSNVRCYMSEQPPKPQQYNTCTPAPLCVTKSGTGYRQGGPNEDYDSCVKECDGGKYSKKCTKKCYKKVYGSTTTTKTSTSNRAYSTTKLSDSDFSLATCQAMNGGGCYQRVDGQIYWKSTNNSEGRWYAISGWHNTARGRSGEYEVFDNGIYRHVYSNGQICQDSCSWTGCDGDVYLNPGFADKDWKNNMETYADLLRDCQAATSCSESTATFAIKVNYSTEDSGSDGKWIYFPYSTKNDKNSKDQLPSVGSKNTTTTVNNKNSTILSYDGCYQDNDEKGKFYQAEWSFPGSWINNKTGEISYVDKSGSKGWRTMPNKFCVPLDAKNVNTKWWNYFYSKVLSGTNSSFKDYQKECFGESSSTGVDKYNIVGDTTKFGKFNWNVTVSCFYALNGGNKTDSNTCTNTSKSRVRSVDLENLFPAKDGSKSDVNGVGRKPGFNWSSYASTKNVAESGMAVDPSLYLTDVQNLGYTVYANDYLDYEFDLSPSDLKQLRTITKESNHNYTSYSGTSSVSKKTGVTRYVMSSDVSKYATKKANDSARECNNMINYNSSQCYVYGTDTTKK